MPRQPRLQYPGAVYHLLSRGDRREPIFRTEADRHLFLATLGEACEKTGWQVHAYCLMENHFHLMVETPRPNLVEGMKWFLGTYTGRFNRKHKLFGHLFSGRYKSLLVENSGSGYLKTVSEYVHLNPVRARLLTPRQTLSRYPWSSYNEYRKAPSQRPSWLRVDRVLGEMQIFSDSPAGRKEFERRLEDRRPQEIKGEYPKIRRGWFYGEDAFRKELLGQITGALTEHHHPVERRENEEERAQRIIKEELREAGWKEAELARQPKGAPVKRALAQQLRQETTMSWKWISQRLEMGAWNSARQRVKEWQST